MSFGRPIVAFFLILTAAATSAVAGETPPAPKTSPSQAVVEANGPTWTLDQLQRTALEHNPALEQAALAWQAAQGQHVQAGLYPNPQVGYAGGDIGMENTSGQQGATINQTIVTFGKLRLAKSATAWQTQEFYHAHAAQIQRVMNDVRAGYYEVLLAQLTIDINAELVRIGNQGVKATEQLKAAMEVSQADVLQAQLEVEATRVSLIQAKNWHQSAWRRLASVVGQPEIQTVKLVGEVKSDLPDLTWEDSLQQLMAQSPELSQAQAAIQRAVYQMELQRVQVYPNLQIGTWLKWDATVESNLTDVQLGVTLPIFNRNQGNIAAAKANYVSAVREVERLELSLRSQLASVFEEYSNARQQVEIYQQSVLPKAQKSLELISTGYREGEFGYLNLLNAQRTYFSANLVYLQGLNDLWQRTIEIEGMLLTGSLEGGS